MEALLAVNGIAATYMSKWVNFIANGRPACNSGPSSTLGAEVLSKTGMSRRRSSWAHIFWRFLGSLESMAMLWILWIHVETTNSIRRLLVKLWIQGWGEKCSAYTPQMKFSNASLHSVITLMIRHRRIAMINLVSLSSFTTPPLPHGSPHPPSHVSPCLPLPRSRKHFWVFL